MSEEQLWLYLPKKVARQFTPKQHIILDPTHEDGMRSNLDFFPIEHAATMTHSAWTQEGITAFPPSKSAFTYMVKHDSVVGGRGPSDAERAYGEILKGIAESDFPFIELEKWVRYGNDFYAYFKEAFQLPEGVKLPQWETGRRQTLPRMAFSFTYRSGVNEERVGYIIRSSREDLLTNTHEVIA